MRLTKDDYMKLPKERLAELLEQRDKEVNKEYVPIPYTPVPWPYPSYYTTTETIYNSNKPNYDYDCK